MLLENHQQFYHKFFELYIYQGSIQLKKDLQEQKFLDFFMGVGRTDLYVLASMSGHCIMHY